LYTLVNYPVTVFLISFIIFASEILMGDKKLLVLGMGGTIAGSAKSGADTVGYKAGELGVTQLLGNVPGLLSVSVGRLSAPKRLQSWTAKIWAGTP